MTWIRWRPDTCGCIFVADFEAKEVQSIEPCRVHKHLDPREAFLSAWTVNREKNQALAERDRG